MTLTLDTVVTQVANQVSVDLTGETAILNLETMTYFGLDPVGHFVWDRLAEPKPVNEICVAMRQEFDVSEGDCQADVLTFLDALDKAGLLTITAPQ
jgi:hypothetical protein